MLYKFIYYKQLFRIYLLVYSNINEDIKKIIIHLTNQINNNIIIYFIHSYTFINDTDSL